MPAEARTLVVVPSLIGSRDDVDETVRNLEVHYLANMTGEVHFALLSDWPDSPTEQSAADDRDPRLRARRDRQAQRALSARRHAPRFYLLHRRRLYNPSQGCWMGWERKRGKLHELNLLLRGDADTTFLPPDAPLPEDVVHVMTLDSDTRMMRDAVDRAGRQALPSAQPAGIRRRPRSRVTAGYSILQPRVTPSLTTGDEASFLQRVFSSNRGIDPYVFAVSDLYQDVFGEGTFTGKGLYHVDAIEAALKGRIPENAVLSHDLLEGALARCGAGHRRRAGRGLSRPAIRSTRRASIAGRAATGSCCGFIFDPQSGVPALSRWKMVDNLRRSLTPIFWVMAAIAGWTLLPFTQAAQWQALLILSLFMAPTFDIVDAHPAEEPRRDGARPFHARWRATSPSAPRWWRCAIVLMAHSRLDDGRRHRPHALPDVRQPAEPAGMAHRLAGAEGERQRHPRSYYRLMYGAVIIAVVGLAIPVIADSTGAFVALLLRHLLGRLAGLRLADQPLGRDRGPAARFRQPTRQALRTVARRTWAYFETFVTAEHNYPAAGQFPGNAAAGRGASAPRRPISASTCCRSSRRAISAGSASPTPSTASTRRCRPSRRMERYRGHLFNWYDTTTLRPLYPLYVSSVDSGNLAGHLSPSPRPAPNGRKRRRCIFRAISTAFSTAVTILDESLAELPDDRRQLRPLRQRLADRIDGMRRAVETIKTQPEMASIRTINLTVLAGEIRKLAAPSTPRRSRARSAGPGRLGGAAGGHLRGACRRTRTATNAADRGLRAAAGRPARARRAISPSRWISPS